MDNSYHVYRCKNGKAHLYKGKSANGNIVAFVGKNSIVIRCPDYGCKRWNSLEFSFPGFDIDFRKAGVVQTVIERGMNLDTQNPSVVVGE